MATGPDDNLYVCGRFTHSVLRYDGETGAFIDTFVAPGTAGLNQPHGMTFGLDGNLYVVSSHSHAVLRYDGATGAFIDVFASTGLSYPTDLLFGPDDNLYVSSSLNNQVLRYHGTTGASMGVFASGGLSNAQGLAFGPADGNLYVASLAGNRVVRFDGDTGTFIDTFVSPGSGGLNAPVDITFGPDGDLYVQSSQSGTLAALRYDGTTGAFVDDFVGSTGGQGYLLFKTLPTVGIENSAQQPVHPRLQFANPYRIGSTIALHIEGGSPATVRIHDVLGRLVRTLLAEPAASARSSLSWNGRDDQNGPVAAGVYYVRAEFGDGTITKGLVLIR
jgi:WD40 repeat protein